MIPKVNNTNFKKTVLTILVTDIRNFSSVARENSKDDIGFLINEYITLILRLQEDIQTDSEIIIDNFLGDGFLIFFKKELDALQYALKLNRRFKELRKNADIKQFEKLGVGTGIHRGEVIRGSFGYGNFSFKTGIGHDVNMTFRLAQAATKWEILVSEELWPDINRHTINTCKDKLFVKGAQNVIWPYSIICSAVDNNKRSCCERCSRYKFCKYNWITGNKNRSLDPYATHLLTKTKYICTRKMLCAIPSEQVVPEVIPDYNLAICGGCDPANRRNLPEFQQEQPIRHCERNMIRGYHEFEDRECCDDCIRYNTCLFNLHRGKNEDNMVCCGYYCNYYLQESCPGQQVTT